MRASDQRWALVTGATGFVGRACVEALATAGFSLLVHGRRASAVKDLVRELHGVGTPSRALLVDMVNPIAVDEASRELVTSGRVPSVVVNAAAEYGPLSKVVDISTAEWTRLFAINVASPLALIRNVVPAMCEAGWGRIIQVSSAAALATPRPGNAVYSVTKAAVDRTLGHMASELIGTGVTVHSFHPGEFASPMWRHIRDASTGRPEYTHYREWADRTATGTDSIIAVTSLIASLLDDTEAERRHGKFAWAQAPERATLNLGTPSVVGSGT